MLWAGIEGCRSYLGEESAVNIETYSKVLSGLGAVTSSFDRDILNNSNLELLYSTILVGSTRLGYDRTTGI